jgi:nicotinamidase/pyrazinamidase
MATRSNSTPKFYDPDRIGTLFYPDIAAIAADAKAARLSSAADDQKRVHLLIVDMQVDFCHEHGTLYVPGAKEDIRRLIEFIYRNAARITDITCSLDSHLPHQIFHPAWWADKNGHHPVPFTIITVDNVKKDNWRPLREPAWSTRYVEKLRQRAKKDLTIWPYHVPIGGVGNALDPELWSAVFWHSIARGSQPTMWTKGSIPQTEHYSVLRPEVPVPGVSKTGKDFLKMLRRHDYILIAGEAASHCVLETVEDLVEEFADEPGMLGKLYILRDCTSPVRHPQIDFAAITAQRYADFEKQGVHFINSTDPPPF